MSEIITVPYKPRNWAKHMHNSLARWMAIVLHRRAGKTTSIINHHQRAALSDSWETRRLRHLLPHISDKMLADLLKNRTYWHGMPIREQIKLTGVWDLAKRISAVVPGVKTNESELLITYPNGSKLQLIGLDDPDRKRGPGLSGLSLDEYSQIARNAFGEVLSKSLADHLGYCIFAGTIQGKDQLYDAFKNNELDPEWFTLWQDIDVSLATEDGATIEALRQALADDRKLVLAGMMTQAEFDQEWYLSHEAAIKGSFYGDTLRTIRQNGQICRVPYDPSLPVNTDWDLGIDAMAIWFSQSTRSGEVRLIDYHEDIGGGLIECIKALEGKQVNPTNDPRIEKANARRVRYAYGEHWGPHDIETREISTGQSRRQTAHEHGLDFRVTEKLSVDEGIEAVIRFLSRCYFDAENCDRGLDGLLHYRRTWQKVLSQFTGVPVHDWASHSCLVGGSWVRTSSGHSRIEEIMPGDSVWTPCGPAAVLNAGYVAMRSELFTIETDTSVLRCTPEHKIFTHRGLIRADALRYSDRLLRGDEWNCVLNSWISMVTGIGFRDLITGKIIGVSRDLQTCTGRYGSMRTGRFLPIMRFTTGMETLLTTSFPTWNFELSPTTNANTLFSGMPQEIFDRQAWLRSERPLNGIDHQKVWSGIANTVRRHGRNGNGASFIAKCAASLSAHLIRRAQNGVPTAVSGRIRRISRDMGDPQPVFDLTVENHACYQANGLLVSNSDAFRGLAVRHKIPVADTPQTRLYPQRSGSFVTTDHPGSFMR